MVAIRSRLLFTSWLPPSFFLSFCIFGMAKNTVGFRSALVEPDGIELEDSKPCRGFGQWPKKLNALIPWDVLFDLFSKFDEDVPPGGRPNHHDEPCFRSQAMNSSLPNQLPDITSNKNHKSTTHNHLGLQASYLVLALAMITFIMSHWNVLLSEANLCKVHV